MLTGMGSLIVVASVAVGSAVVEKVLEGTGRGHVVVFVKVASYAVCAAIALHVFWDCVQYVRQSFGV
jgi:hypothetical protein